jgi:hypothetical protein
MPNSPIQVRSGSGQPVSRLRRAVPAARAERTTDGDRLYAVRSRGHRARSRGAELAGAFAKVWPVVLIPALAALTGDAAALAAWLAWGGSGALVPGSLLRLVSRDPVRLDETSGAWRLGSPPARRRFHRAVGVRAQPGGARRRRRSRGDHGGAGVRHLAVALSFRAWWSFDVNHAGDLRTELLLLGRNAALVGMLVVAILELGGAEKPATMEHGHPARARQHS